MIRHMKHSSMLIVPALLLALQIPIDHPLQARQQYQEKPTAENMNIEFIGDTTIITYDLVGPLDAAFDVGATLVKEGDPNFKVAVKSAVGDIGKGISAGTGRQIRWAWKKDSPPEFAGGPEYTFAWDIKLLPGGGLHGNNWGIFARPNFGGNRFGIDFTYFGSNYAENGYSRVWLTPLVVTMSYAVFENVALQLSFTHLSGDYKLEVPLTKAIQKLLLNRQRLWGDGNSSTGLGVGVCFKFWYLRVGGQFIEFVSRDTDLSPKQAVLLNGDLYLTPRFYVGVAMTMMNQTGLIEPGRVGGTISAENQGVLRRDFPNPTVLTLRFGADIL